MENIKNVIKAAGSMGYTEIPKEWYKLLAKGWKIESASCVCGGDWAWFKPRPSGTYESHGCVCHNTPSL